MKQIKMQRPMLDKWQKKAYKALRICISAGTVENKIISVVGCGKSSEKSIISLNLAISLADIGNQVLFIAADQQSTKLEELTETMDRTIGLYSLLSGKSNINDAICTTNIPRFCILPGGRGISEISELLEGEYFGRILNVVKEVYDYVIIDTPLWSQSLEGIIIAGKCDEAFLVIESGKVRYEHAQKIKHQLEKCGCEIAGVILSNRNMSRE